MASNGYARITASRKVMDVNPSKVSSGTVQGLVTYGSESSSPATYIPISGYSKVAFNKVSSDTVKFCWAYSDGTESSEIATLSKNAWSNYYDVPANATCVKLTAYYYSTSRGQLYYSALA